jgi:hypothetical protein
LKHFANPDFWSFYRALPQEIQALADEKFELLKSNPRHGSLKLKKVGIFWSARIGRRYRAVAKERAEGLVWIWIGTHEEYNQLRFQ